MKRRGDKRRFKSHRGFCLSRRTVWSIGPILLLASWVCHFVAIVLKEQGAIFTDHVAGSTSRLSPSHHDVATNGRNQRQLVEFMGKDSETAARRAQQNGAMTRQENQQQQHQASKKRFAAASGNSGNKTAAAGRRKPVLKSMTTIMREIDEKVEMIMKEHPNCKGKERFLKLIVHGTVSKYAVPKKPQPPPKNYRMLCHALPAEDRVARHYGGEAVVYGMDTCQAYRELLLKSNDNDNNTIAPKPRVSGLYHTGTNGLCRTLTDNVGKLPPHRTSWNRYEVPWGKHMPPGVHRLNNTYPKDNDEDRFQVLPIVVVRDPVRLLLLLLLLLSPSIFVFLFRRILSPVLFLLFHTSCSISGCSRWCV